MLLYSTCVWFFWCKRMEWNFADFYVFLRKVTQRISRIMRIGMIISTIRLRCSIVVWDYASKT